MKRYIPEGEFKEWLRGKRTDLHPSQVDYDDEYYFVGKDLKTFLSENAVELFEHTGGAKNVDRFFYTKPKPPGGIDKKTDNNDLGAKDESD